MRNWKVLLGLMVLFIFASACAPNYMLMSDVSAIDDPATSMAVKQEERVNVWCVIGDVRRAILAWSDVKNPEGLKGFCFRHMICLEKNARFGPAAECARALGLEGQAKMFEQEAKNQKERWARGEQERIERKKKKRERWAKNAKADKARKKAIAEKREANRKLADKRAEKLAKAGKFEQAYAQVVLGTDSQFSKFCEQYMEQVGKLNPYWGIECAYVLHDSTSKRKFRSLLSLEGKTFKLNVKINSSLAHLRHFKDAKREVHNYMSYMIERHKGQVKEDGEILFNVEIDVPESSVQFVFGQTSIRVTDSNGILFRSDHPMETCGYTACLHNMGDMFGNFLVEMYASK